MKKRIFQADGLSIGAYEHGKGDKVALLLHGFPDDPTSMFGIMEILAAQGYRCVAPYLPGYGESDKMPQGNYYISAIAKVVVALARNVGKGAPVLLIGHDWGAALTYAAANLAPQQFSAIVAMAVPPIVAIRKNLPANPAQLRRSWYMAFFQIPVVAEKALRRNNFALIEKLWRDWSPGWNYPDAHISAVKGTFRMPETVSAALAYYRAMLRPPKIAHRADYRETVQLLTRPISVPGLLIAGRQDGCLGLEMVDGWQAAFSGPCRLEIIDHAGHFMQAEQPDAVARAILDFADAD